MFVWPFLFKGMGGRVRPYGLPWTIFVVSGVTFGKERIAV